MWYRSSLVTHAKWVRFKEDHSMFSSTKILLLAGLVGVTCVPNCVSAAESDFVAGVIRSESSKSATTISVYQDLNKASCRTEVSAAGKLSAKCFNETTQKWEVRHVAKAKKVSLRHKNASDEAFSAAKAAKRAATSVEFALAFWQPTRSRGRNGKPISFTRWVFLFVRWVWNLKISNPPDFYIYSKKSCTSVQYISS